jgi:hypothetical protein
MTKFFKLGLIGLAGLLLPTVVTGVPTAHGGEAKPSGAIAQDASLDTVWQPASAAEEERFWDYVLNSPLGIAALNQLAIEGFISPLCERSLYSHAEYGPFQTLLQVECPDSRGISIARAYDEVQITFNRFQDNIESYELERIYTEN